MLQGIMTHGASNPLAFRYRGLVIFPVVVPDPKGLPQEVWKVQDYIGQWNSPSAAQAYVDWLAAGRKG